VDRLALLTNDKRSSSLVSRTSLDSLQISMAKSNERNEKINDDYKSLKEWMCHDDASYHKFTDEEASEIQTALVGWYRKSRRKLPWRGDAPPYNGSTAGFSQMKNTDDSKTKKQKKISKYFVKKEVTNGIKEEAEKKLVENECNMSMAQEVTPYGVWVSEIMLQQTRVEAVIPYYLKWMKSFPTVFALAEASEDEVNAHWAGLGFYRRARMLHSGAKTVVKCYNGELPSSVPELMKINGIGR